MEKACIIAEIGTSHKGDLSKAQELIHAACEAGADVAKFQWVYADEIIHPKTGLVQLPTGAVRLYDRFKSLEQGPEFFASVKEECEKRGVEFLCTPFGVKSAMQLWELGVKRFKIASPELNHLPLIELMAATGLELIVSSGVSRISDIEEALETIHEARKGHIPYLSALYPDLAADILRKLPNKSSSGTGNALGMGQFDSMTKHPNLTLLHCMTSYPAPENEYNLLLIRSLRGIFGVATGISDHSMDPLLVPAVSTILGGTIIEKHFTLSNDSDGLDDPIALAPRAFRTMVEAVRKVEANIRHQADYRETSGILSTSMVEAEILKHMALAGLDAEPEQIRAILGNGVKALAAAERDNYGRTNRSIHAAQALNAGTIITPEHLAIIRSEKILRPGLHPHFLLNVIGRRLSQAVPDGEGLRWSDFLS